MKRNVNSEGPDGQILEWVDRQILEWEDRQKLKWVDRQELSFPFSNMILEYDHSMYANQNKKRTSNLD